MLQKVILRGPEGPGEIPDAECRLLLGDGVEEEARSLAEAAVAVGLELLGLKDGPPIKLFWCVDTSVGKIEPREISSAEGGTVFDFGDVWFGFVPEDDPCSIYLNLSVLRALPVEGRPDKAGWLVAVIGAELCKIKALRAGYGYPSKDEKLRFGFELGRELHRRSQ